jgi:hypothetical protein
VIARPLSYVTLGVAVPAIAMLALAALAGVYRGSDAALALIAWASSVPRSCLRATCAR